MVFLPVYILQQAALLNAFARGPGLAPQVFLLILQLIETTAPDTGSNTTKSQVHDFPVQPNCLEQLGPAVRTDRRYAHFGHDFKQPLVDALAVILVTGTGLTQHFTTANQFLQHTVGQVGINRGSAKAQ